MPLSLKPISSLADEPRLLRFSLRRDFELHPFQEMVIDSDKVVIRAIQQGIRLKMILAEKKYYDQFGEILKEANNCVFYCAENKVLKSIVGHQIHQGIIAIAELPKFSTLEELESPILVFNRLSDASNVGGLLRNAHAFGFKSIIFEENSCSPYNRRSIRVSMGSCFALKIHRSEDLKGSLIAIKNKGVQILASGLWPDSKALQDVAKDLAPNCAKALIIGNEDLGVDDEIAQQAHYRIKIPIIDTINSLNAASAGAVLCYELTRNNLF
ncbi:MAG: RNA methyltransferase [Oligoflexales bacterium]|nr:RNA methyltransferase [Oligoflexales bacterium]